MEGEKRRTPILLGPLDRAMLHHSSLLPLHSPEDGSRSSFRNVVILIFNILLSGRWIKSINRSPHNIIHHRQNLLEFIYVTDAKRTWFVQCIVSNWLNHFLQSSGNHFWTVYHNIIEVHSTFKLWECNNFLTETFECLQFLLFEGVTHDHHQQATWAQSSSIETSL
jgi:hypothetical protein